MAITMATQNIWGATPFWSLRKRLLARGLHGADVVLLQEVQPRPHGSQAHQLAHAMGLEHALYASAGRTFGIPDGIAVISRWPMLYAMEQKLEPQRPDLLDRIAKRLVLRVVIDTPLGRVEVYALHLSLSRDARTRSALAIAAFARHQRQLLPADHAVFGGDFNAHPDEPCLQHLQEKCHVIDAAQPAGPTYPAPWPRRRLDYLLTSPGLRVIKVEKRKTMGSDHQGIVLQLEA
jgi:endonuclease/exonuclease/phosphatase family metal-dependent hydrolase